MIVYIEGCEDALNLDHVAYIEFRGANGHIPARRYELLHGPGAVDPDDIEVARIFFAPATALRAPDFTYRGKAARDCFAIVKMLHNALSRTLDPPYYHIYAEGEDEDGPQLPPE